MMLGLILHSSHKKQPEKIILSIVSARKDLMIHKRHVRFLFIPGLPLVVANQHYS